MKASLHFSLLVLLALTAVVKADDRQKKLWEYQQKQKRLEWEWQQKQQQQQQGGYYRGAPQSPAAKPVYINEQSGRGTFAFAGSRPDGLRMITVVLTDFTDSAGRIRRSGPVTLALEGRDRYPWIGTWFSKGGYTVGLDLKPNRNGVQASRGDRATGTLWLLPRRGDGIDRLTLSGVLVGTPFNANFTGE